MTTVHRWQVHRWLVHRWQVHRWQVRHYLHGVTWSSRKMFGVQGRAIYLFFLLFTVQFSDGETRLEKTVFPFSWGHRLPPLEYNHTCWHWVNLNKWLLGPYRRQISNRPQQLRIHYPKSPSTYFTGGLEVGQLIQY